MIEWTHKKIKPTLSEIKRSSCGLYIFRTHFSISNKGNMYQTLNGIKRTSGSDLIAGEDFIIYCEHHVVTNGKSKKYFLR
jgi:hypothetical protein